MPCKCTGTRGDRGGVGLAGSKVCNVKNKLNSYALPNIKGLSFQIPSTILELFFNQNLNVGYFFFQGSPGLPGSQGHPGDEGGPVSLNVFFMYVVTINIF